MTLADLYNHYRVSNYVPTFFGPRFNLKSTMPSNSSSSPTFYHSELLRALREQHFGILNFSMTSSSPEQASASVVLLEGRTVNIKLTIQGYSITGPGPCASGAGVHECFENLLRAISPLYRKREQETLFAKLAMIS